MSPARILSCSLLATGVLFVRVASATELEPVRFEVEAPDGCVDETSLRNDVSELGGAFRDANLEDRARTFRVEVTRTNEGVRGMLFVRDPDAALTVLDRHASLYPEGKLREEAAALRVEALARSGDTPGARALAARFVRAYPNSPYAERVQSIATSLR